MNEMLKPGATIGILGGGQLGRMLAMAAARLGLKTHIFDPAKEAPAAQVAHAHTCAAYDDRVALEGFGQNVDVITYEFENIPTQALDLLEVLVPIFPGREALRVSQDRLVEKSRIEALGLICAPFANVETREDLNAAVGEIGTPGILKTRQFGYDGKGQVRISSAADVSAAFDAMRGAPAIYEGFVNFSHEVSVIGARNRRGDIACYDPGENLHIDGILSTTTVPARLSVSQRTDAVLIAAKLLNALEYVGVMGVELFVTPGRLIVNEFAPRVHNSGHWTQDGCVTDQFEQHIRAVAGWMLGDGARHSDVVMENLIGADMDRVPELAADPGNALHLYGKSEVRAGRKMGHFNRRS